MADIATIFHWPPSVTDVMPLNPCPICSVISVRS
ncbi:TPA: GpE family phage tail protein [Escherichia coli]|nr:GpE family phage tail protein [Escherichia coli]